MIKQIICAFLFCLIFFSNSVHACANVDKDYTTVRVLFVNGINVSNQAACDSLGKLKSALSENGFPVAKYKFDYFWNPTDGLMADVAELRVQAALSNKAYLTLGTKTYYERLGEIYKTFFTGDCADVIEYIGPFEKKIAEDAAPTKSACTRVLNTTRALANRLSFLSNQAAVIVVPHSQGNFYTEAAYSLLKFENDPGLENIKVVGVAAIADLPIGGRYLSIKQDAALFILQEANVSTLKQSTPYRPALWNSTACLKGYACTEEKGQGQNTVTLGSNVGSMGIPAQLVKFFAAMGNFEVAKYTYMMHEFADVYLNSKVLDTSTNKSLPKILTDYVTLSVSEAKKVLKITTSANPEMGKTLNIWVDGIDIGGGGINITATGCTNLSPGDISETSGSAKFTCVPVLPNVKITVTDSKNGAVLKIVDVSIPTNNAAPTTPTVVSVTNPTSAIVGQSGTFAVFGGNLPSTSILEVTGGATCQAPTNRTADSFEQTCTFGSTVGTQTITIRTAAGGSVISNAFNVSVNAAPSTPAQQTWTSGILTLTGPATRTQGVLATFGVTATGITGLTVSSSGCPVGGATVTIINGFSCTPTISSGSMVFTFRNNDPFSPQFGQTIATINVPVGSVIPSATLSMQTATRVSGGGAHSAAIKADGTLWMWGANTNGQLGDGTLLNSSTPKQIGSGYIAVSAGGAHTLGLKSDGTLWAWGENSSGQIGDGTTNRSVIPKQIGSGFAYISAGNTTSFAIKTDGTLYGWGSNVNYGTVGNGDPYSNVLSPTVVGSGYVAVSAGAIHTIGLKNDKSLWTWGVNYQGQLGYGQWSDFSHVPRQLGMGYVAIAAGGYHSLAIRDTGGVVAWGWNEYGQVGIGTTINLFAPNSVTATPAQGPSVWSAISGGWKFSYIAGTPQSGLGEYRAGLNDSGQLADPNLTSYKLLMTPLQGSPGYKYLDAGDSHVIAVDAQGRLWSWGSNGFGRLGNGQMPASAFDNFDSFTPIQIGTGF